MGAERRALEAALDYSKQLERRLEAKDRIIHRLGSELDAARLKLSRISGVVDSDATKGRFTGLDQAAGYAGRQLSEACDMEEAPPNDDNGCNMMESPEEHKSDV